MKTGTRAATTTLAAIVIFAFTAISQTNAPENRILNHQRNFKEFDYSLQSEIPGIVESTIYTVIEYKNRFPDLDYSRLGSELDEVARDNKDVAISYKARLASMYLTYSSNIQITPVSPRSIMNISSGRLPNSWSRSSSLHISTKSQCT